MRSLYFSFVFLFSFNTFALELNLPQLASPVMDEANILSVQERSDLETIIRQIFNANGPQITIFTVNNMQGYPIEDFSIKTAEKWQLGSKEKDNGLLIVVAKEEREMRIEVGGGLEGDLTDAQSNRYIQEILIPAFKQGDFHGGLRELLVQISKKFQLETTLTSDENQTTGSSVLINNSAKNYFFLILIVFVLGNIMLSHFVVGRSIFSGLLFGTTAFFAMATFSLVTLIVMIFAGVFIGIIGVHNLLYLLMTAQGGGRGGGGGSSGGGWSGGGGGFSGGGSSGRW